MMAKKKKRKKVRNRAKELRHKLGIKSKKVVESSGTSSSKKTSKKSSVGSSSKSFEKWLSKIEQSIEIIETNVNNRLDEYVLNQVEQETKKVELQKRKSLERYKVTADTNPYLPLTKYPQELRNLGLEISDEQVTHLPDLVLVKNFIEKAEEEWLNSLEGVAERGRAKGKRFTQYKVQKIVDETFGYSFYDWLSDFYVEHQGDRQALYSPEILIKDRLLEGIEAYNTAIRIKNITNADERAREWDNLVNSFKGK